MRNPDPRFSGSFLPILGILLGVTLGQTARAGSEAPDAAHAASIATDEVAAPVSTAPPVSTAAALTGRQVYNEVCIACHAPPGLGGAPALGDTAAWAPRIARGMDTVISHALNGYSGSNGSIMPKKGGRLDLSDEEIIGAVEYMVGQVAE